MNRTFLLAALIGFSAPTHAKERFDNATLPYLSGVGGVIHPNGGLYVYGDPTPDGRIASPARLLGKVVRRDYELFSYEEEEELLKLHDQARASRFKSKIDSDRRAYLAKARKLDWPKVIVEGQKICVPELKSSEATDWKEHLTCYEEKDE